MTRLATKASQGHTKNGRDSESNRLGVKAYGGEDVDPGNILVRQRGTKYHPGLNVGHGSDDTLFAKESGTVVFTRKQSGRKYVSVLTQDNLEAMEAYDNGSVAKPA